MKTRIETLIDCGAIWPGMSRNDVIALLGPPDDTGGTSRKYKAPCVYKWDSLEFQFSPAKNIKENQTLYAITNANQNLLLIQSELSELERMTVEAMYWRSKYQRLEKRVDMRQTLNLPVNTETMFVQTLDNARIPIGIVNKNQVIPVLKQLLKTIKG